MTVRLVGAVLGDSYDPHNNSGTVRALFAALERRGMLAARLDVSMNPAQRAVAGLRTFHPRGSRWKQRFHRAAFAQHSRNCHHRLLRVPHPYDLVLQPFRAFQTQGARYALLLDTTDRLRKEWDSWTAFQEDELGYETERRLYREAAQIFTMPSAPAKSLVEDYGVPPERITVVGAGVNIDPLPPEATAQGDPTILFIGRDYRRKGGDRLIEAFRAVRVRVPSARLVVVGTKEAPAEQGVEVLGEVLDRRRIARLYTSASVFCLPSRHEPTGMSLFEAMAHGLPCVGTTVGGIPEAVADGETGLLVPPDDSGNLADALIRLLEDPAYARRLGEAGRERVERELTWDRVIDRMTPALERVAASP
jgi:glycosyltransferase involved in cell wall biosynthesis